METTQLQVHLADQNSQLSHFTDFFWHRFRSLTAIKLLKKYSATDSVLDIGAGAGIFGVHLQRQLSSAKYYFQEPIQSLSDSLVKRFGAKSQVLVSESYNQRGFVLLDVLEHIEDDKSFLTDLKTKMPSGSVLVITCPASPKLWSKWDQEMGHYRRYSKESLMSVCKAAGFEVLESKYIFHAFVLPAYLRTKKTEMGPEFPKLSKPLNALIYVYCKIEGMFSRWLPFGTSVVTVVRKS